MKKYISLLLTTVLLSSLFVFPVNAKPEFAYYDKFKAQYCEEGVDPFEQWWSDIFIYEELYMHQTDGETDWALVRADFGVRAEVEVQRVIFGRAIAANDLAYPFEFTYGVYDVARQRFFDLHELQNEADYPDFQDVLDRFGVGERITEPQLGENLRYYDSFKEKYASDESMIKIYDELYYHEFDGETDWALVQGETFFKLPEGSTYQAVGDRVFRTMGICQPFGSPYAVYFPEIDSFYPLSSALVNPDTQIGKRAPGLAKALDRLNLGEKIGDVNGDGKLSVNDVTQMQRCLAEYCSYPESDGVSTDGWKLLGNGESVAYLSDVNCDEVRDISDVTAMQRKLAEYNAPFEGGVTVTVDKDSQFFNETYLRLAFSGQGVAIGGEQTIRPELNEAGDKVSVFYPLKKGITLYPDRAYTLTVYEKGKTRTLRLTVSVSGASVTV